MSWNSFLQKWRSSIPYRCLDQLYHVVFLSTDRTSILQSSMFRMALRWYLVTKLLSGRTSITYLRWMVARLDEETAFPWISHLMRPVRPPELLFLILSLGRSFSELLGSQAPNIVSHSYISCLLTSFVISVLQNYNQGIGAVLLFRDV